jgi:hypothetical protein
VVVAWVSATVRSRAGKRLSTGGAIFIGILGVLVGLVPLVLIVLFGS